MTENKPKVCAVILNLAGLAVMEDCLRSMARAVYPALELIVVHNGPADAALERGVRSLTAKVSEVIFTGANIGFAAGNNLGIKAALARGADYVLLLNDDTVVDPDFISPLVDEAAKDESIGMTGPRIYYAAEPGKIWFSGAKLDRAACAFVFPGADQEEAASGLGAAQETDYVTGCAALVRRELLSRVGPLDESFFLYWEDSDWGLRAAAAGFRSLVVPSSRIWHKVSLSSGGTDSALKLFHKTRGRLLFSRRHCGCCLISLLLELLRDAAWLAFKSGAGDGKKRAASLLAGAASYFCGGRGPGPAWLR